MWLPLEAFPLPQKGKRIRLYHVPSYLKRSRKKYKCAIVYERLDGNIRVKQSNEEFTPDIITKEQFKRRFKKAVFVGYITLEEWKLKGCRHFNF